jgi:hypothetical protein
MESLYFAVCGLCAHKTVSFKRKNLRISASFATAKRKPAALAFHRTGSLSLAVGYAKVKDRRQGFTVVLGLPRRPLWGARQGVCA